MSKKSLQIRGTREHQSLHWLEPCSCTPRARGVFLRLPSLTEWAFLWVILSAGRKQGLGLPGWETTPNPCGYLPVTNRNFKVYTLKHSKIAQIILEISDHSSLIFEFMSQQTKAFLPHSPSFRPFADGYFVIDSHVDHFFPKTPRLWLFLKIKQKFYLLHGWVCLHVAGFCSPKALKKSCVTHWYLHSNSSNRSHQ